VLELKALKLCETSWRDSQQSPRGSGQRILDRTWSQPVNLSGMAIGGRLQPGENVSHRDRASHGTQGCRLLNLLGIGLRGATLDQDQQRRSSSAKADEVAITKGQPGAADPRAPESGVLPRAGGGDQLNPPPNRAIAKAGVGPTARPGVRLSKAGHWAGRTLSTATAGADFQRGAAGPI